ncbi:glycoprotein 3-alpha-L-fucosyltransferase A-like [Rhopalosiphum maidis]|uniref:glycoprotein 3-alpha-L-fucosyltransferase A-like n=1 Tax=Rhopalosiphum maidis TaxID=43146 RepID=UPI000F00E451|nr:glycoprotein 3-alpha-L-fucosyltransferase A-like [Rhopalosiphum maidis]XP_026822525.1 glycoprotein 3-alpha-L-fucosyltransferase A-like [Rhopalosiphum maidis]
MTNRLLRLLLILVLCVSVLYNSIFAVYWIIKRTYDISYNTEKLEQSDAYNEPNVNNILGNQNQQNHPYFSESIITVTPYYKEMEWNEIANPPLPWYFKDGTIRPAKAPSNTRFNLSQVWPKKQINGDRVEEQLMFMPSNYEYNNAPIKSILLFNNVNEWMVDSGQNEFISKDCPVNRCTITTDKSKSSNIDSILFRNEFSRPGHIKADKQVWILFIVESAYYTELNVGHDLINWTATYRHDSDIVTPYQRWAYYDPSVTQIEQFNRNYAQDKTKQLAIIITDCKTNYYDRELFYATELSKYNISVDVYGKCGEFKNIESNTFLQMLDQDYKFYLAFENSNCIDYVTDKFFVNGLQHNALPVVMGGRREDYERMAPKHSYVHVDDYESPRRLAEYLRRLDADDDLYNEYFRWKGAGEFIDTKFFCRLCAMLHDDGAPAKSYRNFDNWWRGPGVCDDDGPEIPTQLPPPPLAINDIEEE